MTTIELTDDQRRALQGENGNPIDVVDPGTKRRYVLIAQEQYEQLALLERGRVQGSHAELHAPHATSENEPLRQLVRDLPLPPEVAAEAMRYCKHLGFGGTKSRRRMEEHMKLQHFYGGKWIAYLPTNEGPVVVAAADNLHDPVFDRQLSFLSVEERRSAVIDSPTRLLDDESEILTPLRR